MKAALRLTGCAMIGQTAQIAPADKKLYALKRGSMNFVYLGSMKKAATQPWAELM